MASTQSTAIVIGARRRIVTSSLITQISQDPFAGNFHPMLAPHVFLHFADQLVF